ncbi:phosphotransferase [Rhodococcus sp. 7Tela_A2]|uniref:maltokinase N-terminal cap-like domain-containing protein n=1 Tax=Rhodococcus sp. 7Tela_A2 TaxID=3093744 RepID=UPI003BB80C29
MTEQNDSRYPDADLEAGLAHWLPRQRWFAAKGHTITGVRIVLRQTLADEPGFGADHVLVAVDFEDTAEHIYQVPLGYRSHLPDDLAPWTLATPDDAGHSVFVYDGLHDQDIIGLYAQSLSSGRPKGPVDLHTLPGAEFEAGMRGRPLGAEQSNTSVVLGERLLLKMFRRLTLGINPDVELHLALTEVGCRSVAPIRAWIDADVEGVRTTLAMAQDFAANSADGWAMALGSIRDLLIEGDLRADEVGTDFAGESYRMGTAVAEVHSDLAAALGESQRPASGLAAAMSRRLEAAAAEVEELVEFVPAIQARFDEAAALGPVTVQRIHGDLHLGQVLRTPERWLLIDFEGEPAKSLVERRHPDTPLRDVAGMLRSFDYAAHHSVRERDPDGATAQREFRAREWAERNSAAFCDGYAAASGSDPRDIGPLLRAYEIDKAVYEVVYEARHRPSWLRLPLNAIRRLCKA